jgi:hypothetical protein
MINTDKKNTSTAPQKSRPNFRVWLVQDISEDESRWTELAGLWPTKSGKGFKGGLRTPVSATAGRIIILPASFKPKQAGAFNEAAN